MTTIYKTNQGDKNSYKPAGSKKIENSYEKGVRPSDMSCSSKHTNMFSAEENVSYETESDCDDNHSVYSDVELDDDHGDLFECAGDRFTEEVPQTEAEKMADKIDVQESELKERAERLKLQHPDEMEYIRKALVMPCEKEMNAIWYAFLDEEIKIQSQALAVPVIENWWSLCVKRKAKRTAEQFEKDRRTLFNSWKRIRSKSCIRQLSPQVPFEESYKLMQEVKRIHSLINSGIQERIRMIKVNADRKVAAKKASERAKSIGKARAVAKTGMNKNTEWHKQRLAGALALKNATVIASVNEAGTGKRVQRKIRQEKERKEAIAEAARLAAVVVKVNVTVVSEIEIETEEQKQIKQAEKEELIMINRLCIETEKRREEMEKLDDEKKKVDDEEKKELDEFVAVMSKAKKYVVIKLGFKSLKDQVVDRRKTVDKKFSDRCDGFADLSSKEKLAEVLKFTTLCTSVTSKKKCYHPNCRFAHSVDQLQEKQCRFGLGCKFVKQTENGQYANQKFGKTGKSCSCIHPGEHKRGFCIRMGLEYTPETAAPVEEKPQAVVPLPCSAANAWTKVISTPLVSSTPSVSTQPKTSKMTNQWCQVVVDTLSAEKKLEIYGKGAVIYGFVEEKRDIAPIIPTTRKPQDMRGIGFNSKHIPTPILVTSPGFNWVKGAVLLPDPIEPKTSTVVTSAVMEKVHAAILVINARIASLDKTRGLDISKRLENAKAKAMEINLRIASLDQTRCLDISKRLENAKAKAMEINIRLVY